MPLLRERAPALPVPTAAVHDDRRLVWAVRLLPALVVAVLGTIELVQDPPLWYDEAYTRLASSVPVGTLLSGVWHRQGVASFLMDVPPSFNAPYYLLMHVWCSVAGTGDVALRAPSVVCSAAAVAVLAELTRRLAGLRAALVAGLLLATGPLLVTQATQARDYGPALLALSLGALGLHTWSRTGRGLGRVATATTLAGLLHWFTLPVVVGLATWVLLARRRDGIRAAVVLLASCLPAGVLVAWSLAGGTYGAPTPVAVGVALPVRAVLDWSGESVVLAVLLVAAAAFGLWRSRHRLLLACWLVVPTVLLTALELVRPSYFPRYLLFTLVWLVVAAGIGVARLPGRSLRVLAAGVLVGLSIATTVPTLGSTAEEPSPAVLQVLAAEQTAGEPIVPADGRTALDLETYLATTPRLATDLVLPPELFTDQTTSTTVWLVRVVLHENSLPVVPAEQRLIDAGWHLTSSQQLSGTTTDLRVEKWTR